MIEQSMASRDLVRFRSELPEHVLDAAVKIEALHISAPTGEEGCAYCRSVENGDVEADTEVCEHYARLQEASSIEYHEVRPDLTPEEEELLDRDELLELAASRAEWEAHSKLSRARGVPEGYCLRHLWEALPEGYYAVEDPRAGVEDMTYWRRKDKGKNKRPAFDPWPLKARYAPVLYSKDLPEGDVLRRLTLSKREYVHAWYKTLSWPYLEAIVESILDDPVAAQHRFADLNTRCCNCGKKLTNDLSKVYGIGPECRKGLSAETLATYYRPWVSRAHGLHENRRSTSGP